MRLRLFILLPSKSKPSNSHSHSDRGETAQLWVGRSELAASVIFVCAVEKWASSRNQEKGFVSILTITGNPFPLLSTVLDLCSWLIKNTQSVVRLNSSQLVLLHRRVFCTKRSCLHFVSEQVWHITLLAKAKSPASAEVSLLSLPSWALTFIFSTWKQFLISSLTGFWKLFGGISYLIEWGTLRLEKKAECLLISKEFPYFLEMFVLMENLIASSVINGLFHQPGWPQFSVVMTLLSCTRCFWGLLTAMWYAVPADLSSLSLSCVRGLVSFMPVWVLSQFY